MRLVLFLFRLELGFAGGLVVFGILMAWAEVNVWLAGCRLLHFVCGTYGHRRLVAEESA
jgi:hypothetical protein